MRATSFLRTKELIKEDLPTFERPSIANSGRSSLGQSLGRILLPINWTSLTLASPAYGPNTMLEPGKIMSSVTSSGSVPGGMKRTVLTDLAVSAIEIFGGLVAETWWGVAE